jgi:hypothetical protein
MAGDGSDDLERAIDDLYAAGPDVFTGERDALARRLKAEGDDEGARRVRALRKPVRSAWAVDRLVHDDRPAVEALVAAGERLRAAQQRALSGAGADELRDRSDERRRMVNALARRAADLLGEAEPPAAAVEDITATLEAASIDADAAELVLAGRLAKPLPRPAGFGDVVGLHPVQGKPSAREPSPSAADERAERRRHERELRAAEDREKKTRDRVERLRAELDRLQTSLSETRDELRAAEADARGAALEVRRLRR